MKTIAVVIAAIVLAGYFGFHVTHPSATIRYRLTLTVDTPEGIKTGSGVIQVTYAKAVRILGSSAEITIGVKGEAVVVDLGKRGLLFALLKAGKEPRSAPDWIVLKAFGFKGGALGSPPDANIARLQTLHGKKQLSSQELPLLVRFRDIHDPTSVERVDPDNLAASFGPGVRLADATIEITDDPVTNGIEKRLPWLKAVEERGGALDGTRFPDNNALKSNLGGLAFRQGGA
jgi:hypothetical protein